MAARKPRIEYYWAANPAAVISGTDAKVNWRLIGANGEIMCQSTQGYRDKRDARRAVRAVMDVFGTEELVSVDLIVREVGPGRKPE